MRDSGAYVAKEMEVLREQLAAAESEVAKMGRAETILIDALKRCRSLTRHQEQDTDTVRLIGKQVSKVVGEAFILAALDLDGPPEPTS